MQTGDVLVRFFHTHVSHFSRLGCFLALGEIHPGVKASLWEPFHIAIFSFASVTIDFGLNNIFKKASRGVIKQGRSFAVIHQPIICKSMENFI